MIRDERILKDTMKKFALSSSEATLLTLLQSLDKGPPEYCCVADKQLMAYMYLSQSRVAALVKLLKDRGLIRRVGKTNQPRKLEVVQDVHIRQ